MGSPLPNPSTGHGGRGVGSPSPRKGHSRTVCLGSRFRLPSRRQHPPLVIPKEPTPLSSRASVGGNRRKAGMTPYVIEKELTFHCHPEGAPATEGSHTPMLRRMRSLLRRDDRWSVAVSETAPAVSLRPNLSASELARGRGLRERGTCRDNRARLTVYQRLSISPINLRPIDARRD